MTTSAQVVPDVGSAAPDFTLASTSGEQVTLSAFRGRQNVLLAFFPLAFTGTCTTELCAFTDDYDAFTSRDVTVLPISVDATASLREFKAKHAMKTDLLSDFKREVSRAYGVLLEDRFYSARAYFLVDKTGTIRWRHVEEVNKQRRENSEILEAVARL